MISSLPPEEQPEPQPSPRPVVGLAELAVALQGSPAGEGMEIAYSGGRLVLSMPADILFGSGGAALDDEKRQQLGLLAEELLRGPFSTVQIIGHSDDRGSEDASKALSLRRAETIADVFLQKGWQRGLLHVMGRGSSEPIASNETEEGRRQNRRVEIAVLPNI